MNWEINMDTAARVTVPLRVINMRFVVPETHEVFVKGDGDKVGRFEHQPLTPMDLAILLYEAVNDEVLGVAPLVETHVDVDGLRTYESDMAESVIAGNYNTDGRINQLLERGE